MSAVKTSRFTVFVMIIITVLNANCIMADEFSADDERIQYVGRWDFSDPERPWCAWQGSSFKTTFNGTEITADIDGGPHQDYARLAVDGIAATKKFKLPVGRAIVSLVSGLPKGDHRIEIVKETYAGRGRMALHGVHVKGGEGLLGSNLTKPRLRIMFYGDSNLAGASLENEKNKGEMANNGCHYTFAGIAARMLDAEYQNISVSGAITAGKPNSVLTFYNRLDFYEPEPAWRFDQFPADIVVLNIGANDINRKSKGQIKNDYLRLLAALRKAHPKSHIVLMNGYGWDRNEPANYTEEIRGEFADENTSRCVFPWHFDEWHGCEYDHAGMAQSLVNHLAKTNPHWTPVRPIDVMDGFARTGNVANGSFEAAAPFGGYGWRYFEDGAQRVNAPRDCADGDWHLRLHEGTEVHQPLPSFRAAQHAIRLHMRSSTEGVAAIQIEFRDQQWRNEIPDTAENFEFTLSKEWNEYTIKFQSPAVKNSPDPSREPWQAVLRLKSAFGTVDVDNISAKLKNGL